MKERYKLTDAQWNKIAGIFPKRKKMGRPPVDDRKIVNGILWILKTGSPWRELKENYGPWQTVYDRFYKWNRAGLWNRILRKLQSDLQSKGKIDWKMFSVDGSNVRAHKSAAGAKKKPVYSEEPKDHALGYSRGGYGTKMHLICDGRGLPLEIGVSGGQAHESRYFEGLAGGLSIRGNVGRPRKYPDRYAVA